MREAHPRERPTGVRYYVSTVDGTGGRIKAREDDFRVRELEAFEVEPADADSGAYPHLVFRATLRGWDTNDFAAALSNRLGISRERVSWAGTKDKRAVTTQLFSLQGGESPLPDLKRADIDVLGRAGRPVLFGDLAGNDFEIVVRDPEAPEQADRVSQQLRTFGQERVGVPNFFGPQRFGTYRPVTAAVGFLILNREWEAAVREYVCASTDAEPDRTQKARAAIDKRWADREWADLVERLPGNLRYERSLLHGLAEVGGNTPEDFRTALERLPSNLQAMFVHAAQSKLFNETCSRRLERGLPFHEPVPGDVVCFRDADAPDTIDLPDMNRIQRIDEGRVETVARHCGRGRAFVTAPLVGTDTEFGDGEPDEIARAVLDDHDLTRDAFELPGEFASEGARRAILVRTSVEVDRDPLTFAFALPKGSYATTLLREYLKVDPLELS